MTDDIWNTFVNENIVPNRTLIHIAVKIIYSVKLSNKELSIYVAKSNIVENILQSLTQ